MPLTNSAAILLVALIWTLSGYTKAHAQEYVEGLYDARSIVGWEYLGDGWAPMNVAGENWIPILCGTNLVEGSRSKSTWDAYFENFDIGELQAAADKTDPDMVFIDAETISLDYGKAQEILSSSRLVDGTRFENYLVTIPTGASVIQVSCGGPEGMLDARRARIRSLVEQMEILAPPLR